MGAAALATILALCPTKGHTAKLRVSLAPLELVNISEQEGRRYRRVLERIVRTTHGLQLDTPDVPADKPCDLREVSCLHQLRSTLGADRLLVLRVGHLGDTTVIRLTVHDLKRAVRQGSWQEVLRGQTDDDALGAALKRMVAGFAPPPPPPPPPPSPWYKKWWVWTAAGVVVAGGVTAAVLATRGGDGPDHTIVPP
jgi:hypothetical protein